MEELFKHYNPNHAADRGFGEVMEFLYDQRSAANSFGAMSLDYPPALSAQPNDPSTGKARTLTAQQGFLWDSGAAFGAVGGPMGARIGPGWIPAGSLSGGGYDIPDSTRNNILSLARGMTIFNPLVSHAASLFATFSVGEGVKFNVGEDVSGKKPAKDAPDTSTKSKVVGKDSGPPPKSRAQQVLDNFVSNPRNRGVMSPIGQQAVVQRFVPDGELFLGLFFEPGDGSNCEIRTFDPREMIRIYYNPQDAAQPWVYQRTYCLPNSTPITKYYRDWTDEKTGGQMPVDDLMVGTLTAPALGLVTGKDGRTYIPFETAKVYHVAWGMGRRGVSMLAAALPWAQAHKRFMEARISIEQSLARFAWHNKTKGTPQDVAAEKARFQSTAATGRESNPAPAAGSILFTSGGSDMKPFGQDTGADSAKVDGAMLIQMFAISLGLFPHYLGSGEAFRLATATAMEPPMRKLFLRFQTIWDQVYTDIINLLFKTCSVPKKESYVRVDFPELWNVDVPALIDAMANMAQAIPAVLEIDEVMKILLLHVGVSDPQALWNLIGPKIKGRIEKMNDARVMGPNGGVRPAGASDDKRTPQPGGKNSNTKPKPSKTTTKTKKAVK